MWNQFNTANYEGMIAETVTIKGHNGDQINAYSARPIGSGPYPSIVLIHHLPGWDVGSLIRDSSLSVLTYSPGSARVRPTTSHRRRVARAACRTTACLATAKRRETI